MEVTGWGIRRLSCLLWLPWLPVCFLGIPAFESPSKQQNQVGNPYGVGIRQAPDTHPLKGSGLQTTLTSVAPFTRSEVKFWQLYQYCYIIIHFLMYFLPYLTDTKYMIASSSVTSESVLMVCSDFCMNIKLALREECLIKFCVMVRVTCLDITTVNFLSLFTTTGIPSYTSALHLALFRPKPKEVQF